MEMEEENVKEVSSRQCGSELVGTGDGLLAINFTPLKIAVLVCF